MFGHMYDSMTQMGSDGIAKLTRCKKPCFYSKYSLIGKHVTIFPSHNFVFSLWAVSNNTRIETEVLVYPLTSLVAEFGGTMGLFLGVSLITIWDGTEYIFKKGMKIKPKKYICFSQHLNCPVNLCFNHMKILFQIMLFVIFLLFFGLPVIERYQDMEVMVVTSKRTTEGIEAPAITIAAFNPQTKTGWRGTILE